MCGAWWADAHAFVAQPFRVLGRSAAIRFDYASRLQPGGPRRGAWPLKAGLQKTYNKQDYLAEKRAALQTCSEHLMGIVQ